MGIFNDLGPNCSPTLTSQSFPTPAVGFVLTNTGAVLQTSDAGSSFTQKTAVPGTQAGNGGATATDIAFVSATTGFATAGGTIYRTADGANTWTPVFTGGNGLNSLFFQDANTGYAVGGASTVVKTTNGGTSWTSKPGATGPGGPLTLTKIRCGTDNLCLIVNDQGTGLVRTADGGDHYEFVVPASAPINAAAFANPSRAVAAGANGGTYVSSDGGQTFTPVGSALTQSLDGARALSSGFVYAWGQGGAVATSGNSGATWTQTSIPSSNAVTNASFADSNNGNALDSGGTLWSTNNGGTSWARKNTGGGSAPNDVATLSSSTVILIGPKGVRRSTNGGRDFEAVSGKPVSTARLDSADVVNGSVVFAYGSSAILYSSNQGKTWKSIDRPPSGKKNISLEQTHCTSTRVCWALGRNSHLFRTANGGRTWTDVTIATGANDLDNGGDAQLSFDGSATGYVAIPAFSPVSSNLNSTQGANGQGWVLSTTDGGNTWAPQLVDSLGVNGLAATGSTDYALTDTNHLFVTTSNGAQGQSSSLTISPSVRTIKKTTTVSLTVTLSPFNGGEQVLVSGPGTGSDGQVVTISSSGTATLPVRVSKTSSYVAQWAGDADTNGDGSKVLVIKKK
jgi:photosystem II stability/assembly factor-like uncharacterized protein